MAIKQKVVRTYSLDWTAGGKKIEDRYLIEALNEGYLVVMSNSFNGKNGETQYVEYIVEKNVES